MHPLILRPITFCTRRSKFLTHPLRKPGHRQTGSATQPFVAGSVMVDLGLFGDVHKGNCTCNYRHSLYSKDWDILPILSWTGFLSKCRSFANPVKSRIFSRQIPVNQNALPVIIGIRCILKIGIFCRSFPEPVFFPNVGVLPIPSNHEYFPVRFP